MHQLAVYNMHPCITWRTRWTLIFISTTFLHTVDAQGCPNGWFGRECLFRCHCKIGICNRKDGDCQISTCVAGYFGSGCQYVDLAYHWAAANTAWFMNDHSEYSCNNVQSAEYVCIGLQKPFRFSWIRIDVTENVQQFDFKVILNPSEDPCTSQKNFYVSNITVDVTCSQAPLITSVTVRGNIAGFLCSIYISGGRNVAIKQNTNQSHAEAPHSADKAVDGIANVRVEHGYCASSNNNSNGEWWYLTFNRPQHIFRVIVTSSEDQPTEINGFDLFTFTDSDSRINRNIEVISDTNIYDINLLSTKLSMTLIIEVQPGKTLTLCEVEVYGETLCPDGTYGIDCHLNCTCTSDQTCNVNTGICSDGCPGHYGLQCDIPCSLSCADNRCHQRTGNCLHCNAGYKGPLCTENCPVGNFGKDCLYSCSNLCKDRNCSKVNGECLQCIYGFKGPRCKEIEKSKFEQPLFLLIVGFVSLTVIYCCCRSIKWKNQIKREGS